MSSTFVIDYVFADDDSFVADFDKKQYFFGDSISISGDILELGMPIIALSIYDPDEKIISANNLEISNQTFSKTISLDSSSYEKSGTYKAKLEYGSYSKEYFFNIENSEITTNPSQNDEIPLSEILILSTNKKQYTGGDIIWINGQVSSLDASDVLIGVYDPFGMPTGFYLANVDSNLEFSSNFFVKSGVNFRIDGTYSIKAHYGESEKISFFDYYENLPLPIDNQVNENNSVEEQPTPVEEQPTPVEEQPTPVEEQPTPVEEQPTPVEEQPTPVEEQPTPVEEQPTPVEEQPTPVEEQPTPELVGSLSQDNGEKQSNSEIIDSEILVIENNIEFPIKKQTHLTVEDLELGKMLNQINLECDSNTFVDTISYYDGMGPALYRLCQFEESLDFFNDSLTEDPNNVEILVNKGSTLGKLGYFPEAIIYYDQAIKIDPNFLPAKNNKANIFATLQKYDEAILLYHEVLKQNPNYVTAKSNLAITESLVLELQKNNISDTSLKSEILVTDKEKDLLEQSILSNPKKSSTNFLDDVGSAFSSLRSFFNFLN
ncbi:tetratricopeptide repeat protein [Nitrosopumilus sp.]|uniref:tetratricopeptide repeat protein n=1 Tax=Nitrosopumilus sp. TaxID=2024843 RepID=UPI003B59361A